MSQEYDEKRHILAWTMKAYAKRLSPGADNPVVKDFL